MNCLIYKENIKDNVDIKTIEEMVNNETWMSSDEAEKYFKIEVETSLQAVACSSEYLEKFCNIPKDVMRNRNELELFNFDTELLILEEN